MTTALVPAFSREMGAPSLGLEEPPDTPLTQGDMGRDPQMVAALSALYGPDFPPLKGDTSPKAWAEWVRGRWAHHGASTRARLHLVERNRKFREGEQWIDSRGGSAWREPPKPKDAARIAVNMVAPALDLRVQIVSEQRPGFRARPATQDPDDLKKADAQQIALEYQYDQQNMAVITRELAFWVGTDGVCFLELYWDPERGPWHEAFVPDPQTGQPVPVNQNGQPAEQPARFPLGDVTCRVRRIEQVRVSAEATGCYPPWYWIIKDVMPHAQAVREYGVAAAEVGKQSSIPGESEMTSTTILAGYVQPSVDEPLREQDTVERHTMYCEPSEYLPEGLQLVVVGDKLVRGPIPLLAGVCPMVRYTDGSTDPAFYPRPNMETWIPTQQVINAIISKWVENIRLNAGPKFLAREGAVVGETLVGATSTVIGIKGTDDLNNLIRPLESMGIGPDAKELLQLYIKRFEDLTGWNDVTRGSFSSEQSGRAILAIREQLERLFAPEVASFAVGHTDWAKKTLAFMRWGYDMPRVLGVEGHSRPDLARALSSEDFDGATDVFIDPESMMPMPRAMKQFLLDDAYQKQLISPQEYRRRQPYANVRNLSTPDDDQEAVARRNVETIRQTGMPPQMDPTMWVYDEAIHQDILQRELLLAPDIHPQVKMAAWQWWQVLAQQAMMKMGMVPPGAPGPQRPQPQGNNAANQQSQMAGAAGMQPSQQHLSPQQTGGGNNPLATDPNDAARRFEQTAPR